MNKKQVRRLKSHFQDRWQVMRHNQKNTQKILLLEDAQLVKRFRQGRILVYDCLGEMFRDIADNFDTVPCGQYDQLLMINNIEFKYLDTVQLYERLCKIAAKYLLPQGQIFCTINHRYLRYDRVNLPVERAFDKWLISAPLRLRSVKWLPGKARLSFGDVWLDLKNV